MSDAPDAADVPLAELARALCTGELEPASLLDALAARFALREGELHAFVEEPADALPSPLPASEAVAGSGRFARLRAQAAELQARFPAGTERPPLFAVPVAIKDIFHVDGFLTQAGSSVPPSDLAGAEGTVLARLRAAGALVLGKTVTTEFAYFAPGETRNPHHRDHTPGGSSSGSAAAVAAHLAPLALGTQTIGSIIRPAAFCGVVGFKPTYGRVPNDGLIPLAPSFDQVGWFTADVEGAAYAASVVVDGWNGSAANAECQRPVLAVPEGPYLDCAARDGHRHLDETTVWLSQEGFELKRVGVLDDFDAVRARHDRLLAAEAAEVHRPWYPRLRPHYHEKTVALLERGRFVLPSELPGLRASRAALRSELEDAMDSHGIDLWIAPAASGAAPAGLESTGDPVMNLPWTHAGLPTVSLPVGEDAAGLPLSVQLVGRHGADEALIAWARVVERALA